MARYTGPVCRLCRREDMKLFLKGDRCYTDKCGFERRLDNIVYRFGFASDHAEARQLVRHGHFTINGKKVNIPSYLVRAGDVVTVREKSRKVKRIEESLGAVDRRGVPQWLELDKEKFEGRIKGMPAREDFTMPIREQLIVELYSK